MLETFAKFIEANRLFSREDTVLLAVSGGRDSVVLAHLMNLSGYHFAIAHCNFHLRPGDCDRDESFVRSLAEKYGVPIHVAQFDTGSYAAEKKLSIEEAARDLRYGFFDTLIKDNGYACVATGHHRDDSIETFFINLLRGTGIAGLHGIRPKNGSIVRPLLPFGRDEIDAYVKQHQLRYVEDYTNSSLDYRRNQIRHQLMPLLRQMQPSIDKTMQSTIEHLADAEQVYRSRVDEIIADAVKVDNGQCSISYESLRGLEPQRTILFEILNPYGFNEAQVKAILADLDRQSGCEFCSTTHRLVFARHGLVWRPIEQSIEQVPAIVRKSLFCSEIEEVKVSPDCLLLDADRVEEPLTLRHPQDGDRFQPFGMNGASKKLSDFFKDQGFSAFQKQQQWLLVDGRGHILWVAGYRASEHCRITSATSRVLKITLSNPIPE